MLAGASSTNVRCQACPANDCEPVLFTHFIQVSIVRLVLHEAEYLLCLFVAGIECDNNGLVSRRSLSSQNSQNERQDTQIQCGELQNFVRPDECLFVGRLIEQALYRSPSSIMIAKRPLSHSRTLFGQSRFEAGRYRQGHSHWHRLFRCKTRRCAGNDSLWGHTCSRTIRAILVRPLMMNFVR